MQKNKLIVFGGFGFIGYHLTSALIGWGYNVIVFGHRSEKTRRMFDEMARAFPDQLELHEGEIDPDDLHRLVHEQEDIVGVFHLAALTSTTQLSDYHGGSIVEENGSIDSQVFAFCDSVLAHRKAKSDDRGLKLIYVSTAEVYGSMFETERPLDEESHCAFDPFSELHSYPLSKLMGETMLRFGGHDFAWNIIRLQNPYGPMMNKNTLISYLLEACASESQFFNLDCGNDSRPYIYVDDAVAGIVDAYESDKVGGTYNIAGESVPLADLVRSTVTRLTNDRMLVVVNRGKKGTHRHLDTSRARKDLVWRPIVSLEDGMNRTFEFYVKHASVERAMKNMGL